MSSRRLGWFGSSTEGVLRAARGGIGARVFPTAGQAPVAAGATVLIAALALVFDWNTPRMVSVGIFYVAIVLTGFWYSWPKAPVALGAAATSLIIVGYFITIPDQAPLWEAWMNRVSDIGSVWLTTAFVSYIRLLARRLQAQNEISNALSREMAHRVGNSLQLVASFLRLRAASAGSESSRHVLETACSHVMCIGKIQRMLAHGGAAGVVDSKAFLEELISELCPPDTKPEGIRIALEADAAVLGSTVAIALGALLIELVNNALKHAFRGVGEGTLAITFRNREAAGEYVLEVEDDGIGIGQMPTSDGMGMQSVGELVRLIQGSITCQHPRPSPDRPGTRWRLVLPHGALS